MIEPFDRTKITSQNTDHSVFVPQYPLYFDLVYCPLCEQGYKTDDLKLPSQSAEQDKPGDGHSAVADFSAYHILLAEDVEINRIIFCTMLEATGLRIDCAVNGREAVQLYKKQPDLYDLILMDVQMPEMDGYEATQLIRDSGLANAETIPIIATTANVFQEDIEKCREAGMNGHIGKPIDFGKMTRVLGEYLNQNTTEQTGGS